MSETSTLAELAEKLKRRNEEELRQVEQIERDALKNLSESLRKSLKHELNTLRSDIESATREAQKEIAKIAELSQEATEEIETRERWSAWRTGLLALLLGLLLGAAIPTIWAISKIEPYEQNGVTTYWVPLWSQGGK